MYFEFGKFCSFTFKKGCYPIVVNVQKLNGNDDNELKQHVMHFKKKAVHCLIFCPFF